MLVDSVTAGKLGMLLSGSLNTITEQGQRHSVGTQERKVSFSSRMSNYFLLKEDRIPDNLLAMCANPRGQSTAAPLRVFCSIALKCTSILMLCLIFHL